MHLDLDMPAPAARCAAGAMQHTKSRLLPQQRDSHLLCHSQIVFCNLSRTQGMASLQDRLEKAFGALTRPDDQPAWKPSQQQIFRSGAGVADADGSSDEEYRERQRREAVPGELRGLGGATEAQYERWKLPRQSSLPLPPPPAPPPSAATAATANTHTVGCLPHCRPGTVASGGG